MPNPLGTPKGKLILAIVLLVVAGVLFAMQWRHRGPIPGSITYVCVATGERFNLDPNSVASVPWKNPKTGEETLIPCRSENGVWKVSAHYRPILQELGEKNRYVDNDTLVVRAVP